MPPELQLRARLEAWIEHAIALLDVLDGDADLEDGGDDEPSLAAPEGAQTMGGFSCGCGSDCDLELSYDRQGYRGGGPVEDELEEDAGELCAWRSGDVDQRLGYEPMPAVGMMYEDAARANAVPGSRR